MSHAPTSRRPWRRRNQSSTVDPAVVFRELYRRQLRDIEDCRIAWERGGDPLAVCVAATKCGLQEWLEDALLVLLADGADRARLLRNLWKRRTRDATDAARAAFFAGFRSHPETPKTLDQSYSSAEKVTRHHYDAPKVGESAVKASYRRVKKGLANDGRYFAPLHFQERLDEARERVSAMIEAELARNSGK